MGQDILTSALGWCTEPNYLSVEIRHKEASEAIDLTVYDLPGSYTIFVRNMCRKPINFSCTILILPIWDANHYHYHIVLTILRVCSDPTPHLYLLKLCPRR